MADDTAQSLDLGTIQPPRDPKTIADGLRVGLGELTFEVLKKHIDHIILVSEQEIAKAMFLLMERMKIVVEPSGAVPFAALLKEQEKFKAKKVGLIVSGGNLDFSEVSNYLKLCK